MSKQSVRMVAIVLVLMLVLTTAASIFMTGLI